MNAKTTSAERKWSSYELEVYAVIKALKKFRPYLLGLRFKIITDCQAFLGTLNKKDMPPRVAGWALALEEFDYTIEHRGGERMKHVDALSRYPTMLVEDTLTALIRQNQDDDPQLRAIRKVLDKEPYEDYIIENGLLMKNGDDKNLIVLPSNMQMDILRKTHGQGHFGVKKILEHIQQDYYIPNLKVKLENLIKCCVPCILSQKKRERRKEN